MELICFCWMLLHDAWDWLADWWDEPLFSGARVRRPQRTFKPCLEGPMEERIVPAVTDVWIAPASAIDPNTGAANWDVGTNWSAGHSPAAGDTAIFASAPRPGGSGSDTPCLIPAGDNLPTLGTIQFNNWKGTLTISSDLAANTVNIAPRAGQNGSSEIIINSGSHLYALQSLTWAGGNVSGNGNFEVGGTDTISGTDPTDKPTLGAVMDIGTSYLNQEYAGNLSFGTYSEPLVVNTNANIYVNDNSTLLFQNKSADGSPVTAISNGDTLVHSIIVNGGTLDRTNLCELFVCMGLKVQSGQVNVSNPQGQNTGNPFHFTKSNADGFGMDVNGGQANLNGDMTADAGAIISNGTVGVSNGATLTLGINASSGWSELIGGYFALQGKLVAHGGGFYMDGGTVSAVGAGTSGNPPASIALDTGSTFEMYAGEIDITDPLGNTAVGNLTLTGNFFTNGGKIVDNVNSNDGTHGSFTVTGDATLSTDAVFSSMDVANGNNVNKDWLLMAVSGTVQGDFSYSLPPNWTERGSQGSLLVHEP